MITVIKKDCPLLISYCEDMIDFFTQKGMGDCPEKQVYELTLSLLSEPVSNNETWPAEVLLLAKNIENLSELSNSQRNKVMHHINRMLLEQMPTDEITIAAKFLTKKYGESHQ